MKIGILGYGKEGQCAEKYFTAKGQEVNVFDNFTNDDLPRFGLNSYHLILRSPSVHPQPGWSSMTKYFFDHCPCKIIGVTGTKGKGTTASLITALFEALGQKVWLVGNIGTPALEVLDQIQADDVVVYEMSSFQLWDLEKSPHIAVVLGIEPDHLNVHDDYEDYINAKANITKYQTAEDYCIYYKPNPDSKIIAKISEGKRIPYPVKSARLQKALDFLTIPGKHNRENAEAALLAVAAFYNQTLLEFIRQYPNDIKLTFERFQGLPHRLQCLRELNHVKYYDDNFATTASSLAVALNAFPDRKIVLIAGGRDKTDNQDLPEIIDLIRKHQVAKTILIGESGHLLAEQLPDAIVAESLAEAVEQAQIAAEQIAREIQVSKPAQDTTSSQNENPDQDIIDDAKQDSDTADTNKKSTTKAETVKNIRPLRANDLPPQLPKKRKYRRRQTKLVPKALEPDDSVVVLMSPAAASFDMFESVYDRGTQFQKLVRNLKSAQPEPEAEPAQPNSEARPIEPKSASSESAQTKAKPTQTKKSTAKSKQSATPKQSAKAQPQEKS